MPQTTEQNDLSDVLEAYDRFFEEKNGGPIKKEHRSVDYYMEAFDWLKENGYNPMAPEPWGNGRKVEFYLKWM